MQWPYTYDSCDVGTVPNQTLNGLPLAAVLDGDHAYNFALSYLPGQRLSRCTCDGENHPGPKHPDGTYVGRSAPEIDMLEAQMGGVPVTGEVSQSAQWAVSNFFDVLCTRFLYVLQPFNHAYTWDNSSVNMILGDPSISRMNTFVGNVIQQASSVVTKTNQRCYELADGCFSTYGVEV